ncbi:MAG: 50S ribosomal protein L11 methyltransferase [Alistipes sp.]|nr:50S ribosomal protein L11 methyltransferase [Alistipes sp.]
MKRYTHLTITCPDAESAEILTAFLSDYPFECFSDNATAEGVVVETYLTPEDWAECGEEATNIINDYGTLTAIKEIEDENWNARWEEESFQPVDIDGRIVIRSAAHPAPADPAIMDIIVAPTMSFGSGHHHTTRMMCRLIHASEPARRALDVGCGTGVLSFVALKSGAGYVDAIDIDPWSSESAARAAELNGVSDRINIITGTVEAIEGETYDAIYANINRNIILGDIARYTAALNAGGCLLVSGFLTEDVEYITSAAAAHNLTLTTQLEEEGWVAIAFQKGE